MLNRRHLRVKVLQSLYAFFQSGENDLEKGEKELLFGIDKIYELYLYQMLLLKELMHAAEVHFEEKRNKKLPRPEDLNPNKKFSDNIVLSKIRNNTSLKKAANARNISWNNHDELIRKLFHKIIESKHYKKYLDSENTAFKNDLNFVVDVFTDQICSLELLHSFYEEESIYWLDDWEMVNIMLTKSLKMFDENADDDMPLIPLYKDPEDKIFARELFKRTILNSKEFDPMISERTQNWDIERIALMDIIIMKMAITEILKFPEIPVKVTLNEYIELSKMYSTPKSKVFVNGVLDKIVDELYKENKINKFVK